MLLPRQGLQPVLPRNRPCFPHYEHFPRMLRMFCGEVIQVTSWRRLALDTQTLVWPRCLRRVMLLSEDSDFFVLTVDSRHWTLKVSLWVIHDTPPKYAAMHKRKNLAETTILAFPAVILRKNGAIQYSQSLLHCQTHLLTAWKRRPARISSHVTTVPGTGEALRYFLNEQTYLNSAFFFIFNFFRQEVIYHVDRCLQELPLRLLHYLLRLNTPPYIVSLDEGDSALTTGSNTWFYNDIYILNNNTYSESKGISY